MSRYHSYINSSKEILALYDGGEPFSIFIRKYFSQHKKFGSRDRKTISHLCYCFFRLGKWRQELDPEERILTGLFLCSNESNEILEQLKPGWNKFITGETRDKLPMIGEPIREQEIFPWINELSPELDTKAFIHSHLQQPDLFLRLRPGFENTVRKKLSDAGISFCFINEHCLALPNSTKLDEMIDLDKEAIVHDYNSQRIGEFLELADTGLNKRAYRIWDCCAGSGGKSLLLYDLNPSIHLTVSDIRESIIVNLKNRFQNAGVKKYKSFIADLSIPNFKPQTSDFELIICDAPCTGSGTWSRTPEQLYFFTEDKISKYQDLQKKILENACRAIRPGGYLLYSTCSVFKKENDEVVEWLKNNFQLRTIKTGLLKGYDKKADTLFAALLQNPL